MNRSLDIHMRFHYLLLPICLLFACKKTDSSIEPEKPKQEVIIDCKKYATVDTGTQIWTSVGYAGSTGSGIFDDQKTWKYQWSQMKNIVLPNGWRVPTKADVEKLFRFAGVTGDYVPLFELLGVNENEVAISGTQLIAPNDIALKFLSASDWNAAPLNSIGFNSNLLVQGSVQISEYWCSTNGQCTYIFTVNADGTATASIKHFPVIFVLDESSQYKIAAIRFVKDK